MIVLLLRQNTIRQISSHLSHQKGHVTTFNYVSKTHFSSQFDVDDFIRSIIMIGIYILHSSVKWIVKRLTFGELHIVKWGYLSFLLSSLFCNVLSNSINSIENLHRRTFFFFPKCVQLLIFHTMSSTNKVSSSFVSNKLK